MKMTKSQRIKQRKRERREFNEAREFFGNAIFFSLGIFLAVIAVYVVVFSRNMVAGLLSYITEFPAGWGGISALAGLALVIGAGQFHRKFSREKRNLSPLASRTKSLYLMSLLLVPLMLVSSVLGTVSANKVYPYRDFNACMKSLSGDNAVAMTTDDEGNQFATVGQFRDGKAHFDKFSLTKEDGSWVIKDMNSGETLDTLPGC